GRLDGGRPTAAVGGDEVVERAVPLRVDVDDVVPAPVLGRRLDRLRLQELLNQRPGLLFDLGLEVVGHRQRGRGGPPRTERPGLALLGHERHSLRLLPCLPFQNGQKGQSSPWGKSSPSSCGQPMFPWLIATDLTPYWRKKPFISCRTFGLVVTSVATHRFRIG